MSTQSPQIVLAATTTAQHYNWIAAFSNALDALGVTRTADTGQIDLTTTTTIPVPPGSAGNAGTAFGTPAVYQVRKLSAPGFADIYLRFDYGIYGNNNTNQPQAIYSYPAVQVSIGKGSNGAGVLTAVQTNAALLTCGSDGGYATYAGSSSLNSTLPSQNPQQCDFASDGQNYLTIMLGENAPVWESHSIFSFGIERSIDPGTGNYDGDGFCGFCGHTGGNSYWYYADIGNSLQWNGITGMPSIAPPFNIGGDVSKVDLFPFVGATRIPKGAPTLAVAYYASGVNSPVSFPVTLYSVPHTYKACPRASTSADPYNTGTKIAFRFD